MSKVSDLLLRRPTAESIKEDLDREPDVMSINDEAADEIFSTLSSATARSMLAALYDQPRTASDLADHVETSIQNVNYHLTNLRDAELIEVVETWYSDQGKEMKVYAPTNEALVLFAGDDIHQSSLLDAIKRLVGFVGVFALVSVAIDRFLRRGFQAPLQPSPLKVGASEGAGGTATYPLPPELMFFLGCLLAIVVVTAWEYVRSG